MKRDGRCTTFECAGCRRQTSVTAGTILVTVWFWAAYRWRPTPTASLPCSSETARYLTAALGFAHKLRAKGHPLSGLVEIDEASLPFRTKDDPQGKDQPRRQDLIVGDRTSGTETYCIRRRHWPSCACNAAVPADRHNSMSGKTAAHLVLIHQVFSNLKGWARGVTTGCVLYLDEFVFRFNRRKTRHAAFRSLFRIATNAEPLIQHDRSHVHKRLSLLLVLGRHSRCGFAYWSKNSELRVAVVPIRETDSSSKGQRWITQYHDH